MSQSAQEETSSEYVRWRTLEGGTPRDIAQELGYSTQAIYAHLRRLRASGALPAPKKAR